MKQIVSFYLDYEDYEKLRDLAYKRKDTISNLLRIGTKMVLKKYTSKDKVNQIKEG